MSTSIAAAEFANGMGPIGNDPRLASRNPSGAIEYLPAISEGGNALRSWRKPKRYETPEDLQQALSAYLDSLQGSDGAWIKPPTLSRAGLFLGSNSKSWHEPYAKHDEFKPTIDWLKFFIEAWRGKQVIMPSKGVYAQGLMFLMDCLDALAAAERGTDSGQENNANTRHEVKLMLDSLWRSTEGDDPDEGERARRARVEIDKLARMTPHERMTWHKAKQIEAEEEIEGRIGWA